MEQVNESTKVRSDRSTNEGTASSESDNGGAGGISISPTATHAPYPKIITLDVGGRKYKTFTATLRAESGFFRCQISDHFTWEPEADGSYFLDANPDLFGHLLDFMRRPSVFPLFYTKANGIEYDLYNRLEIEAEYFQMDILHAWIKEKKYLKAIVTHVKTPCTERIDQMMLETCGANESLDRYITTLSEKVYVCPREIDVHRGAPHKCGAACRKAQGDDDDKYEDVPVVHVVSARSETVFVESACKLG